MIAGRLHGLFMSVCVLPRCGFTLSLFYNYILGGAAVLDGVRLRTPAAAHMILANTSSLDLGSFLKLGLITWLTWWTWKMQRSGVG